MGSYDPTRNLPVRGRGVAAFLTAVWFPWGFIALVLLVWPLAKWWLSPTTRRWSGQARFGPRGWVPGMRVNFARRRDGTLMIALGRQANGGNA